MKLEVAYNNSFPGGLSSRRCPEPDALSFSTVAASGLHAKPLLQILIYINVVPFFF